LKWVLGLKPYSDPYSQISALESNPDGFVKISTLHRNLASKKSKLMQLVEEIGDGAK
jgi:hypothetical protein